MTSKTTSNSLYTYDPPLPQGNYEALDEYTPNGLNQYETVDQSVDGGTATTVTFAYDDNGSLTSDGGAWTYSYDVENRLTQAVETAGITVDFAYDPNGKLYKKSVDSTVTDHYLTDGNELIADYNGAGTAITAHYLYGANIDERIAYYNSASMNAASRYYYHSDYQGSVIAMSNDSGVIAAADKYSYSPFGVPNTWDGNPYRYTGRRLDGDVKLYYYRARWYHPDLGRFMQTDPIGYEDNMHMYAYVGNDPINKTDPTGLYVGFDDALAFGVGALVGVVSQGLVDLANGEISSPEVYAGAAVGGGVAGEVMLYTANPYLAGSAGMAAANVTEQSLNLLTGKQTEFSLSDLGKNAAAGLILGPLAKATSPSIAGITTGKGSMSAVTKQMTTKSRSGQIKNVSGETVFKMTTAGVTNNSIANGVNEGAKAFAGMSSIGASRARGASAKADAKKASEENN